MRQSELREAIRDLYAAKGTQERLDARERAWQAADVLDHREQQLRDIAAFAMRVSSEPCAPQVLIKALQIDIPSMCSGHHWPCGEAEGAGDCTDGGCVPLLAASGAAEASDTERRET